MAKDVKFNIKLVIDGKEQIVTVSTAVKDLAEQIAAAQNASGSLRNNFLKLNQTVDYFRNLYGAASDAASALSALTEESRSFGTAMRAANTMAGKDESGFGELKDQVSELAKEIPVARDALADGLYQVISNGVPEDNWIDYLRRSARASVGGIADLGETVKVTSTVIKNYGLEWSAAGDIQDKIQLTAKYGVTTFEQLAAALPRVTANAATLGVSIDELMATFATLTGVSGNTAEVSTQLAAVFTALVKPSSEAAAMAEQMGIRFDAAAIRAAGGMQNFLRMLDISVKRYAATSGVLEEEVYGRLFGSAEALRALIPLTGELSAKFSDNVAAMADSTGTIDQAFEQMGRTGSARLQELQNRFAGLGDAIAEATQGFAPYLNFAAQLGTVFTSVMTLANAFKTFGGAQRLFNSRMMQNAAATLLFGRNATAAAASAHTMSTAMRGVAASATAAKVAIRAAFITTGVGAVIAAATFALEKFLNAMDDTTEGLNELNEAEEEFKRAGAEARVAIDEEIKKLGALIASKADTTEAVRRLNEEYGRTFGTYETAAEWYDILTQKSSAYARQVGYEAQARKLATQIAEKEMALEQNRQKQEQLKKEGKATYTKIMPVNVGGLVPSAKVEGVDTEAMREAKQEARELADEIAELEQKMALAQQGIAKSAEEIGTDISQAAGAVNAATGNGPGAPTAGTATPTRPDIGLFTPGSDVDTKGVEELRRAAQPITEEYIRQADTLREIDDIISRLTNRQQGQQMGDALQTQKLIDQAREKREGMAATLDLPSVERQTEELENLPPAKLQAELELIGLDKVREQLAGLKALRDIVPEGQREQLDTLIGKWQGYADTLDATGQRTPGVQDNLRAVGSALSSLSGVVGEGAGQWMQWASGVLSAIASAIPAITSLLGLTEEETAANAKGAATKAANSVAGIPFVGPAMAVAAIASVVAALASIPKFAKGGIAYGPTLGMFGEYAGASRNPEVVAPLDRLRSLIEPAEGISGEVRFEIEGDKLVGILRRRARQSARG